MSETDSLVRLNTPRRLPLKTWSFAAILFAFGIWMLTAGEQ
jgi:hypothetical protein